jgi:hypothetical protein
MPSPNPQSPFRQQVELSHESPVRVKNVHSNPSYQNDLLEDARLAVLDDLGSCIPEIPFQTFMDHLAPPQPDFNLKATIMSLKSASILTASDKWTVFDKAPKDRDCSEDAAFKPIPDIFTQVVDEIVANSQSKLTKGDRSTDFVQNPSRAPTSAERHNASRPDGYLLVKDRKVLSCEYKRKDGDEELDDVSICQGVVIYCAIMTSHVRMYASACGACNTSCGMTRDVEPLLA